MVCSCCKKDVPHVYLCPVCVTAVCSECLGTNKLTLIRQCKSCDGTFSSDSGHKNLSLTANF